MKTEFWMGTESSFETYTKAIPLAEARKTQWEAKAGEEDTPDYPPLYERFGDVGVIKITGSLIPGQAEFLRYYGITGYEDIKAAFLEGVADKNAKSLMIYSDSGGGSVAGVEDAEQFIANVAKVKPLNAYSEFSASAAYWLTSVAKHITTSTTGINGSLGVIRVVTEYSKAYEKEGITKTVMRAGRYKALGNQFETLTEDGKAEIQSKLDDLYQVFIGTVANHRGTTEIIADQVMGQGREFLGKRGVEAGLVDAIGSFDDALAYARGNRNLQAQKPTNFGVSATASVAQASAIADNAATSNQTGTQMHLTPEQLAAIAAGASVDQVTAATTGENPGTPAPETPTAPVEPVVEEPAAPVAPAASTDKPDSEIVTFLKTELASAQKDAASAKSELAGMTAKVTGLEADLTLVSTVVQASVKNLNISLGRSEDVTKLSATDLVAAHAAVSAAVQDKFKTGGVARSTASTQEKPVALIAPRDAAAVKSMFNIKR